MRPLVVALALLAAAVALAGPRLGATFSEVQSNESNRIVVLDVSNSMAARDVGTSRLDAAKAIARRIIDGQQGRIGLVVFESEAEVVAPLTTDNDAVEELLETVEAGQVDSPGSDFSAGLLAAVRLADADPSQKADVVFISDGEDQGTRLDEAIRVLSSRGMSVSTVLVGSTAGANIPTGDGGMLRDDDGKLVTTWARPETLQKLASATGGRFFVNPFAEHALDALAMSRSSGRSRTKLVETPIERFQWPLGAAFFLFLFASYLQRGAE